MMNRREGFAPAKPTSLPNVPPPPPPPRQHSVVYPTSDDLIRSEAYQHGRTQGRLHVARQALERIAAGRVRKMTAARAVAKLALEMSAEEGAQEDVNND